MPIAFVVLAAFLGVTGYFIAIGFGVSGSVFGKSAPPGGAIQAPQPADTNVEGGGPPASVMLQLQQLRAHIAAHPKDDVAITQLGDMYLAAGKYAAAIPLYESAIKVNPSNVAAKTGLEQAREGLAQARNSQ